MKKRLRKKINSEWYEWHKSYVVWIFKQTNDKTLLRRPRWRRLERMRNPGKRKARV